MVSLSTAAAEALRNSCSWRNKEPTKKREGEVQPENIQKKFTVLSDLWQLFWPFNKFVVRTAVHSAVVVSPTKMTFISMSKTKTATAAATSSRSSNQSHSSFLQFWKQKEKQMFVKKKLLS